LLTPETRARKLRRVYQDADGGQGEEPFDSNISANVYSEDPASLWRIWYTFLVRQGGSFIKDGKLSFDDPLNQGTKSLKLVADWAQQGLIPKNAGYAAMVALFTAGRACFMINGNWEVPTLVDLKKQGKLAFDYGVSAFPICEAGPLLDFGTSVASVESFTTVTADLGSMIVPLFRTFFYQASFLSNY
jgi:ABC-type glycerol-3-phosphate transport system substrate-binding protein